MRLPVVLCAAALALALPAAAAQIAPPSGRTPPAVPDAVEACASCHGPLGAGDPAEGVPRIAGLTTYYSERQLRSYVNGSRRHPAMEAIARSLSTPEMAVVSAYFAQVDARVAPSVIPPAPAGAVEQGRLLATQGSRELQVQACNNCHGPGGEGEPPAIPYLAGQGANYLIAALNSWRSGARRNDAGDQMAPIARALTPETIVAVARYYSSLSPPPPGRLGQARLTRAPIAPAPSDSETAGPRVDSAAAGIAGLPTVDLAGADPERGRAILASGDHGCAACHAIPGVRWANGVVGPPLEGMAQRGFIAGQLPNRPDVLVAFLLDPSSLVPSTGMPRTGLSPEEALHIAAYLSTLER